MDSSNNAAPLHDWGQLDEEGLRKFAAQYVGWATNEMADPEDLTWTLEQQFPVREFHSVPTHWPEYYRDEIRDNPRYDEEIAQASFHTPIVISIEHDEIIIWDGWHRLACAIERQDECILTIVGRQKTD